MAENQKNIVLVVIVAICLGAAVYSFVNKKDSTTDSIQKMRGSEIWVKCRECDTSYTMDKAEYFDFIRQATTVQTPALTCQECGKDSVYRAVKCGQCGEVFFYGTNQVDYADRCPHCNYSESEQQSK